MESIEDRSLGIPGDLTRAEAGIPVSESIGFPMDLTPVRPVSPAAPYIGGKRNLAQRLVALIATIPHQTYVEPFVGMGGVFLRRTSRPCAKVIKDLSNIDAHAEDPTGRKGTPISNKKLLDGGYNKMLS